MTSCFLKLYTPTRVCEIIIRNWSAGQLVSPKKPDKSLGRSIAPRGSSRSNCQVKAILHGGIETEAEMRGRHRGSGEGHRGVM